LNPVTIYNCSLASLTSLTVNGTNALASPLAGFSVNSPTVSFVSPSTNLFVSPSTISAFFNNGTKAAWTVQLPFNSDLPVPSYSLWCYFNGLVLCNGNGIITSTFYQRLFLSDEKLLDLHLK
jgi:hypothetical protein